MPVRALIAISLIALIAQAPAAGAKTSKSPATLLAAGDIAVCSSRGSMLTSRLIARLPGTVAALGDEAYPTGSASDYRRCYKPTWGRFKARTRPTLGNHEYKLGNANAYFSFFGSKAAPPGGYYSYTLGTWHVVVINSNCKFIGGCGPGSAELNWLQADLAAHPASCTLAYWHHARFSEGPDTTYDPASALAMQPVWETLVNAGADVAVTAHDHMYERFTPLDATGQPDPSGMREFVAGTGGGPYYRVIKHVAGIQKAITFHWGVLQLKLSSNGYSWKFLSTPSGRTLDSGSGSCH
jgi:alkaline phosphatase